MKKIRNLFLFSSLILLTFLTFFIPRHAQMQEPDSRFGVNAFVLNRYQWQEWNRPIEVLKDARVNWVREEFVWSQIEPEKGKYNWDFYDRAFDQLSDSNIDILAIIDYSAPWATEDKDRPNADKYMPDINEWRKYVSVVVDRYGHKVKYWQIWNEPNVPTFFKPEPNTSDYFTLLKNAYEVIKAKDPNYKVVLGGVSGVDAHYLRLLKDLGAGNYFDIMAVHPYRFDFKSPPESSGLVRDLELANQVANEFGNKPIWLTEFGWPTDNTEGVSEDMQAKYLTRTYLLSFIYPNIKKVFWYDLRDDGNDKDYREHNFGLIRRDYSHKKSFTAYKNLINLLEHTRLDKVNMKGENGIYDLSFKNSEKTIRVVWKVNGNDIITVNQDDGGTKILDYLGNEKVSIHSEAKSVHISDFPVYIVGDSGKSNDNISFGQTYEYEYVDQSPFVTLKNGEEVDFWLKIKNTGTAVWKNNSINPIMLGTCRNQDRESTFFSDKNWLGNNRPAKMLEESVPKGGVATFVFKVKANLLPNKKYSEYFCPLAEGAMWMKDIGIYWDINVNDYIEGDKKVITKDYSYEYIDQSPHLAIKSGDIQRLTLRLKNNGNKAWEKGKFNLGTSRLTDRDSIFSKNWKYSNRILLEQDLVNPGEIGTFSFDILAPNKKGTFREYFRPVVEGLSWLSDIGIYWEINVS